jgi:hypothetical protein
MKNRGFYHLLTAHCAGLDVNFCNLHAKYAVITISCRSKIHIENLVLSSKNVTLKSRVFYFILTNKLNACRHSEIKFSKIA